MKNYFTKVLLAAALGSLPLATVSLAQTQPSGVNIALHQKVQVEPRSNYAFTKDRDPQRLTDGIYASTKAQWDEKHQTSSLWVQDGALSWAHKKPVIVTIDLGKVQPIAGLIYSTAAGKAGVVWPDHVYAAASDDGKTWHYIGDLVKLSPAQPPAEGYANLRYIASNLQTHGRYVSLGVMQDAVITIDEIEVLRGNDSLLNQSAGRDIPPMPEFVAHETITSKARRRQNADIAAISALINQSSLSATQKSTFKTRLDKDATATENMEPLPVDFKTVLPLTDTHRDILAVHGEAMAAQGIKPLTIWKKPRYAWLPFIHQPDNTTPTLDFSMLKNQFRTDAILLTNASAKPLTVQITLQNAPAKTQPGWLQLDSAIWTDTYQGIPVQDALLPLKYQNGIYTMEIPAGITGKLWVTMDSSKVPSGVHKSTFTLSGAGQKITVPLNIDVSQIAMGTPRMSLTMWDYTNGKGMYGITENNRAAAIKLMRSHYVDSPFASGAALPFPKEQDFDANNNLTADLDFSNLDHWIAMWPGARNYMVFRNVRENDTFAGTQMGTPAFNARVGNWMKAIAAHLQSINIDPTKLVICPVDEARNDEHDAHLLAWGKAIKAGAPQVRLFSDPIWREPAKAQSQESFSLPDILCPHPDWADNYFVKIAHRNKQNLWFYNGLGLRRLGDPQLGYRQMAWRVFRDGGVGEGFWSFGDLSGAATSWNEYNAARPTYAPAFIDTDTVYNSIHWDAVRDGVTDYEELALLRDAIQKSSNAALKTQAQKVLNDAVAAATTLASEGSVDDDKGIYDWNRNIDPTVVDAQLLKVRAMLETMR